ncbi:hypothetical protein [Soymovirus malvae]|nr:hypothetical protein [Malva associated soymovirus 1]
MNFIHLQKTSCQYHIIAVINKEQVVPVLIDTGSCFSQIHEKYAKDRIQSEEIKVSNFENQTRIYSEKTSVELSFSGTQTFRLSIYIDRQPNEILLGLDFLDSLEFSLNNSFILLNGIKHKRINLPEYRIKQILNGSE